MRDSSMSTTNTAATSTKRDVTVVQVLGWGQYVLHVGVVCGVLCSFVFVYNKLLQRLIIL